MIICKICNKSFKSIQGLSLHIKQHNISKEQYYLLDHNKTYCETCNNETTFLNYIDGYRRFCCPRCAQINEKTRNRCKKTCIEKYGTENVYQSDVIKNKIKFTMIQKYGVDYSLQNKELLKKQQNTMKTKFGVSCGFQISEVKERANINSHCSNAFSKRNKISKLETYIINNFNSNNINYVYQYSDDRYPYNCDFYLPDVDMFIEVNAHWTHGSHIFNINDENDINILKLWQEKAKTSNFYKNAIKTWTIRDIQKVHTANKNKLNYIILWNKVDVINFLEGITSV